MLQQNLDSGVDGTCEMYSAISVLHPPLSAGLRYTHRALAKQLGAQFLLYGQGALLTDNIHPDENTSDAAVGATDMDDDDDVDMLGDMDDIDKSDIAQVLLLCAAVV